MKNAGLTIAFVGCGNMGAAVLHGLLDTIYPEDSKSPTSSRFTRFIACTNTKTSAVALKEGLGRHRRVVSHTLDLWYQSNEMAFREADVIVLGVKPYMAKEVLQTPWMREAAAGKLVISLLAGLSVSDIRKVMFEDAAIWGKVDEVNRPYIAKAIPNLAARYGQSMTILEESMPALPPDMHELLEWTFSQVGKVKFMSPALTDAGSVLVTTCLATLSVPLDGILDGAVVEGLKRGEALDLAVQGVIGLGTMLQNGHHPAVLRENISSPRGCTIQTLLSVEREATRAVFADALVSGMKHLRDANGGGK
ncbi:pyrroline-5-carboxylate reductase dimerization-domain-containing protein [Thelonectria olida]|uniref:Pyrroline-5-carboxylate reductase dimerization-domain-containing protein n=1 Tax=Thelonectria olida TaxID=1576542 RepID=A0A9P9AVS5_9HYPO|nr:pyrroline-5-carboxylate reductase dimerization-domain-containing protein [Thelonectria olida]